MTERPQVNLSELTGGLLVIAFGAFVIWEASGYAFGHLTRMGPGFFPVVLGAILVALGAFISFESRGAGTVFTRPPLRASVFLFSGVLAFGLLLERAGLVPATFALVVLAGLAERKFRPITVVCVAIALSAFGVFVFIRALAIPMRPFWWN